MKNRVGIHLSVAEGSFAKLLSDLINRSDLQLAGTDDDHVAFVLLDIPATWAFTQLDRMNSVERARTVVLVQGTNAAYSDVVASYHISGVVPLGNEPEIVSSIYAAAARLRTYSWRSGLTYMELRVSRLLLRGMDTESAARELRVSSKTINAHVSNALSKLGYESRSQYIAALFGQHVA